jgi:hypothetical protein
VRLICHPLTPVHTVLAVTADYRIDGPIVWLRFMVDLTGETLAMPALAEAARADNLWQTTCFELFARATGHTDYIEYNLSPNGAWAAYAFGSYRAEVAPLVVAAPPLIGLDLGAEWASLETTLTLPDHLAGCGLEIGLSAVIEETDGTKSYWALAHPPGKPDFHHSTCFALTLPAPDAA